MLVSSSATCSSASARAGRVGRRPTMRRQTLGSADVARAGAVADVVRSRIGGIGPNPSASTRSERRAGGCRELARRPGRRDGGRRRRAAVRGRGRGHRQHAVRGLDGARRRWRRATRSSASMPSACTPAHTPTTSTIESSAPTSWKCTSSSVDAVHVRPRRRRAPRRLRSAATRTGSGRSAASQHRARMSASARCAGCSAASTRTLDRRDPVRSDALDGHARLGRERGRRVPAGRSAVNAPVSSPDVEQRAEELVAGDAGRAVEIADHGRGLLAARLSSSAAAHAGRLMRVASSAGAEAVVDVDDADAAGAGVEHREQRGDAAEVRAVAHARGHGDDGHVDEPGDERGQRALHAGDGDDHARVAQQRRCGRARGARRRRPRRRGASTAQPMTSAQCGRPPRRRGCRRCRRSRRRRCLRAAGSLGGRPTRGGRGRRAAASGIATASASACSAVGARREHDLRARENLLGDRGDLLGRLALAEDHLGEAAAHGPVVVDARLDPARVRELRRSRCRRADVRPLRDFCSPAATERSRSMIESGSMALRWATPCSSAQVIGGRSAILVPRTAALPVGPATHERSSRDLRATHHSHERRRAHVRRASRRRAGDRRGALRR